MDQEKIKAQIAIVRAHSPEKADELQVLFDQALAEKNDRFSIKLDIRMTLEKFEGDIEPGKKPFETIVREYAS